MSSRSYRSPTEGVGMTTVIQKLGILADLPEKNSAPWLVCAEDGIAFLKDHIQGDTLVLYASLYAVFIHGVLVPEAALTCVDREQLSRDFVSPGDSWVIQHVSGGGKPERMYLGSPLQNMGPEFQEGEKLVFLRSFAGDPKPTPVEISQKLVHALDLHFVPERNAWCRLDENGDIADVIKIVREQCDDWVKNVTLVTISANDFNKYMRLSNMALLYHFDFTRTRPKTFLGWNGIQPINFQTPDLFYHGGIMDRQGSYINGHMIVRPSITYEEILAEYVENRDPSSRQYASFKAIDLKTRKKIEISANPKGLSTYFEPESTLPLEMSPAFFRAEVLQRYKSDLDKYDLQDRSIACRGAWSLRTYDVTEQDQVHTYLRYLGELPYKEQLYWQAFNEWPKGWLSERAITTDFKGEFHHIREPLVELRQVIQELDGRPPTWWQPRGETRRKAVHYPVTNSISEWGNEILALDQLVNEGFLIPPLRTLAKSLGLTVEDGWRAPKLLEEAFAKKSGDQADAKTLVDSLRHLRELRNHLKGHSSDNKQKLARDAISTHGSYRVHFEKTVRDLLETIKTIKSTLA